MSATQENRDPKSLMDQHQQDTERLLEHYRHLADHQYKLIEQQYRLNELIEQTYDDQLAERLYLQHNTAHSSMKRPEPF